MNTRNLVQYNATSALAKQPLKKIPSQITHHLKLLKRELTEVLFITTFPPRECGIATYSQDLIGAISKGFSKSFDISICALVSDLEQHRYTDQIRYTLNTDDSDSYRRLAREINEDINIGMVVLQHEFGLFDAGGKDLIDMIQKIQKPVLIVFHTVLPTPDPVLKLQVQSMASSADALIVMTQSSSHILIRDYLIKKSKIHVIPHGTHLVDHGDTKSLKAKYGLQGKKVLTTFGFLGSGKSIETTLDALPEIIRKEPDVMFLIIGKTHPSTIKREGEFYRDFLMAKVAKLGLQEHVLFVNAFVPLAQLLEYLQLTDIYLFTSKDPNQAVSGTFAYAISCGCPIISTPIPHAREVLKNDAGIIIDFCSPKQLSTAVIDLLKDDTYRKMLSMNGLHRMASTAWENAAIAHALLISSLFDEQPAVDYNMPEINLSHFKKLTTDIGMIQFAKVNMPDIYTGYTLDDNARALVAICQLYSITFDENLLKLIQIYFTFIKSCLQEEGNFLNYMDKNLKFTTQNQETNLEDSNGRAIWALGFLLSKRKFLPVDISDDTAVVFAKAVRNVKDIHSTRSMAFMIKGLFLAISSTPNKEYSDLISIFAERLYKMYLHESDANWQWYESYLTYGNSIIPEAMLCAADSTGNPEYRLVAKKTFDFLLSKTFIDHRMQVISNQTWMHKGKEVVKSKEGGEQPIDVAYTILALKRFGEVLGDKEYFSKMKKSFHWFLGKNHLNQIIYNPCTGGCYDGLEEYNVNLNQGAESTVSYLMARLAMDGVE